MVITPKDDDDDDDDIFKISDYNEICEYFKNLIHHVGISHGGLTLLGQRSTVVTKIRMHKILLKSVLGVCARILPTF
jgi:hypothetical protein